MSASSHQWYDVAYRCQQKNLGKNHFDQFFLPDPSCWGWRIGVGGKAPWDYERTLERIGDERGRAAATIRTAKRADQPLASVLMGSVPAVRTAAAAKSPSPCRSGVEETAAALARAGRSRFAAPRSSLLRPISILIPPCRDRSLNPRPVVVWLHADPIPKHHAQRPEKNLATTCLQP